ncbi:MAG: hypothetical protein ACT4P3_01065 [Betaproteobacteria bacterium]
MVAVFPMMLDFARYPLEPAHAKIAAFCREHGIEAIDLLPRLRRENAAELRVFRDGHPNARAHAIFAAALYGRLRQRYADVFRRTSEWTS